MPAAGTARANALRFERFATPDTLETDVRRAIAPRSLFVFMTAADALLAAELRVALAAAAEDVRADVLTAAPRFALPAETDANAFARFPTPAFAVLAAAEDTANALILPPVAEVTACAEAIFAIAPTLIRADRASAPGATR